MWRRIWVAAGVLLAAAAPVGAAQIAAEHPGRTAIFFYPWYGNRVHDGAFEHWQQNGHRPPNDIASAFYPVRGAYSSGDPAVLDAQMAEIARAGVAEVISSWWGRGSREDERLPAVLTAAGAHGIEVAAHLEPYAGRSAASTEADIAYLRGLGVRDFYVYDPMSIPLSDWAAVNGPLHQDVRVFAGTAAAGWAAAGGFAGVYTYDIRTYGGGSFGRLCGDAHRLGLLCAPSVGPGFDARRATGDALTKPRRNGATYDAMWRSAIRARPDVVTITSYNEWHEGTQIEPASPRRLRHGFRYASYAGAWGLYGAAASRAYLERTAYWTGVFAEAKTSAEQPKTSALQRSASSTPASDGWSRSTSIPGRTASRPSASEPSSEPKQRSVLGRTMFRRPV